MYAKKNRHWAWKRCPVSSLLLAFTSAWHQIYWGAAECYSQCSISCTFSTCKFHLCVVLNLHTYLLFTYTLLKILHILHFYLCIFRGIWEIVWKCKTLKYLKFKFSEKATKIEKIFAINLTMCSNRQIDGEDFINFFGLLRKHNFTEGQIVSEENCYVFNSSKKFLPSGWGKNLNFQVRLLKELKTPKFPFDINWPLKEQIFSIAFL